MQLFRTSVAQSEIKFLEYRLAVLESWPSSPRKHATIEGILLRLDTLRLPDLTRRRGFADPIRAR